MYKVSIQILKALKDSLEHSNNVLKGCLNGQNDEEIKLAIEANDEQIRIITESFYIN